MGHESFEEKDPGKHLHNIRTILYYDKSKQGQGIKRREDDQEEEREGKRK